MAKLVWDFLSNLHLTLGQWAAAVAASIIGGLVIAFKIQGGRLHEAQVQLLLLRYNITNKQDEDKITVAKAAMNKAIKAYEDSKRTS